MILLLDVLCFFAVILIAFIPWFVALAAGLIAGRIALEVLGYGR